MGVSSPFNKTAAQNAQGRKAFLPLKGRDIGIQQARPEILRAALWSHDRNAAAIPRAARGP